MSNAAPQPKKESQDLGVLKPVATTTAEPFQKKIPREVVINVSADGLRFCCMHLGLIALATPGFVVAIRRLATLTDVDLVSSILCGLSSAFLLPFVFSNTLNGKHNAAYLAAACVCVVISSPNDQPRLACALFLLACGIWRLSIAVRAIVHHHTRRQTGRTLAPHADGLGLPFTRSVEKDSEEFAAIEQLLETMCAPYAFKYPYFELQLAGLYKVENPVLDLAFEQRTIESGEKGNVKLLVHGTTLDSVASILSGGFKLPSKQGMFGTGIYFADCPLKSWQYCRDRHGLMILSDVELGKSRPERSAAPQLGQNGTRDLRPSWFEWLFSGAETCDSVTAVAIEEGGSVRVPEYVIYSPEQAAPRYVLQFRWTRPLKHIKVNINDSTLHEVIPPTMCELVVNLLFGLSTLTAPAVVVVLLAVSQDIYGLDLL